MSIDELCQEIVLNKNYGTKRTNIKNLYYLFSFSKYIRPEFNYRITDTAILLMLHTNLDELINDIMKYSNIIKTLFGMKVEKSVSDNLMILHSLLRYKLEVDMTYCNIKVSINKRVMYFMKFHKDEIMADIHIVSAEIPQYKLVKLYVLTMLRKDSFRDCNIPTHKDINRVFLPQSLESVVWLNYNTIAINTSKHGTEFKLDKQHKAVIEELLGHEINIIEYMQ